MDMQNRNQNNYFEHDADIGIIGRGETLENCFENTARTMFEIMADISTIPKNKKFSFDFEEEDVELALVTWLNLLLAYAREHQMILSDFRIKRKDNKKWHATVSGDKWQNSTERGVEVKGATLTMLSIKQIDHTWEARCVVDV